MKASNGGGVAGFFKRIWHSIITVTIATKWELREMFSRVRKLDLTSVTYRKGDVAVITGGTRGLGYESVKTFLTAELHVIIGCRKVADGEAAVKQIRSEGVSSGTAEVLPVDNMSLESVRTFAEAIIAKNLPVKILLNNAGIMFAPYKVSEDGHESQFQTNYLSHFLLTWLLLPTLAKSGTPAKCSRVVNVSSCAHYGGKIDFGDIDMEKFYSAKLAYANSKLMQVVSSEDLNTRFVQAKLNVRVYSLHPGVVNTDLYKYMPIPKIFRRIFFWSAVQGAQTQNFVSLSPQVESQGGLFFANSRKSRPNSKVHDVALQQQLFDLSCKLVGITEYTLPNNEEFVTKKLSNEVGPDNPFIVQVN